MSAPVKNKAVLSPNLGLYYNKSDLLIPKRALKDGYNFRIKDGKLNNYNLGKTAFGSFVLNGRVMKVFTHTDRTNGDTLFFATPTDIYKYNPATTPGSVTYMTPRYDTGTVAVSGTAVTGTGTLWLANAKINDQIMVGAAAYSGTNPAGNDTNTKILHHFNGVDATTTFVDFNAGGSAHAWTAAGNAQVDTAQSKFGGASLLLDGTGDWISAADSADFTLGSGDFTIECWIKSNSTGTTEYFWGQSDAAATAASISTRINRQASGTIAAQVYVGGAPIAVTGTTVITNAVNPGFNHVALVRTGNVLKLFINGVQEGGNVALVGTVQDSANNFRIGAPGEVTSNTWNGWIDEFRLSNSARWTANFTPPTEEFYTPWFTLASAPGSDTSITLTASMGTIAATAPYTLRRLYVTGLPDWWSFDTFLNDGVDGKDRLFTTNGVDWVQTWAFGDTQMTQQSAMAFKCKTVRSFSNMMIYENLTSPTALPTSFINSDVGLPTHAGSLGTGLSEQFIVHDGTDGLESLALLSNSLIFYSNRHIVGAQFVGDPDVFVFKTVDREIGPCGPFAVAEFGDYHEFMGPDGAYRFDGVGANEVHSHVMRYVRSQMDPARRRQTYTHFIDVEGEAIWSVPAVSDPTVGTVASPPVTAWGEHYLEDVGPQVPRPFSKRAWPFTASGHWTNATNVLWSSMTLTWADYSIRWIDQSNAAASVQELAGDSTGHIWIINTTQDDNGVNMTSYVQFPRFPTGNMREKNMVQRWYPYASPGVGNLDVTSLISNFATGVLTPLPALMFDTTLSGNDFVSPMAKGRFAAVQFGSNGVAYSIEGYDYDIAEIEGGIR